MNFGVGGGSRNQSPTDTKGWQFRKSQSLNQ